MWRKLFYLFAVLFAGLYLYLFGFHRPKTLWTSKYRITDRRLREVSGIVFSKNNPDFIWMQNDGRSQTQLFLVDRKGKTVAEFSGNVWIHDWEDISISVDKKGNSYLYAGDIGDNAENRPYIKAVKFKEPVLKNSQIQNSLTIVDTIFLKYADGPRDAEAMFIDPVSDRIYIISKREANPGIYSAGLSAKTDTVTLQKKAELHIKGVKILGWVTAASISNDGSEILIRTYGKVYYWKRRPGESVEQALQREPFDLPHVKEVQGEAICFTPENGGYYTVSEGKFPYLNYNQIKLK